MLERPETADGETETRGQARRGARIDQQLFAVLERHGGVVAHVVSARCVAYLHQADLAPAAAPLDRVGDEARAGPRVRVQPLAGAVIHLDLEIAAALLVHRLGPDAHD